MTLKSKIEKILLDFADLSDSAITPLGAFDVDKASSSLTALIIKWLEGKRIDIYQLKHGATVNNTWSEEGRNQLITELIGELK